MITCANCNDPAIYQYLTISYCERDLPRFLRDRNGKPVASVQMPAVSYVPTNIDLDLVPDFPEAGQTTLFTEEPVVESPVEDAVEEPLPVKKKAASKAK